MFTKLLNFDFLFIYTSFYNSPSENIFIKFSFTSVFLQYLYLYRMFRNIDCLEIQLLPDSN